MIHFAEVLKLWSKSSPKINPQMVVFFFYTRVTFLTCFLQNLNFCKTLLSVRHCFQSQSSSLSLFSLP